jgi:rhodanese-related sulfurtransferase
MFSITPDKIPAVIATFAVICLAAASLIIGQPCMEEVKASETEALLNNREMHVHPGELLYLLSNDNDDLYTIALDVRSAEEYESFHINDAHHAPVADIMTTLSEIEVVKGALDQNVIVVMSNDETAATEAWHLLTDEGVANVFILDGGLNNWITVFAADAFKENYALAEHQDDEPGYLFDTSMVAIAGQRLVADPNLADFDLTYETRVNIGSGAEPSEEEAAPSSGGCG